MKKLLLLFICLVFIISSIGCSGAKVEEDGRLDIICTIFPIYDWVRNITDGVAEPKLLLDNGVDLHSFQPDVDDMVAISTCDVFIFIGGESDAWVKDALKNAVNKDMLVINLMDILGESAVEEEQVEGMQTDESEEDEDEEEAEYDEHIWLSFENAEKLCKTITEKLSEKDKENTEKYKSNSEKYRNEINEIKNRYIELSANAKYDTVLVADRFPFRYLADEIGIKYYAAFSGCSAESEASFETVAFLSDKIDELNLKYILITENSDGKIADTIIANSENKSAEILVLDSMQSETESDIENGKTYLSVAEKNLETLQKALIGE